MRMPRVQAIKPKGVFGAGTNDADYRVGRLINGIQEHCPVYMTWYRIINACYGPLSRGSKRCEVTPEWLLFSNFAKWMEAQDWEGNRLSRNKSNGDRLFSPATCQFLPKYGAGIPGRDNG